MARNVVGMVWLAKNGDMTGLISMFLAKTDQMLGSAWYGMVDEEWCHDRLKFNAPG